MIITLFLLKRSSKVIFTSALLMIFVYPLLMFILSYDTGWNFQSLNYIDFWTIEGFIRNLFYNGFHPVIPWSAFMLVGLWFGKQDLKNDGFIKKTLWISLGTFGATQILSRLLIFLLSEGDQGAALELGQVLGTSPMPPLPIYMISGSSIALFVISACILIGRKFEHSKIIDALNKTGQLALTFYVAHVILGMGIVETIEPGKLGKYPVEFSVIYALAFSLLCILFAIIWRKYKASGPLEWVMRKLMD